MIMEGSEGSSSTLAGFTDRRRRSAMPRRPRDIKGSLHSFTFMQPSTQPNTVLSDEANPRSMNTDSLCRSVSENTLKLKLKLGGVTRTFQTNSEGNRQKPFQNKVKGNGLERRHVQKTLHLGEIHQYQSVPVNGASMSEKSKRGLKKRPLDSEPESDDDGDEEIRYLEKLKSKRVRDYHEGKESAGGRRIHSHSHDMEDKEHLSSDKLSVSERKKPRIGMVESLPPGAISGQVPTTRTRAIQSGKDSSSVTGSGPLEFPDGLPCASSKRQKPKLSEVEQQSKKAEAAQRRRMQSEKAFIADDISYKLSLSLSPFIF